MFRDPSRRITAALLVATALLIVLAWRMRADQHPVHSPSKYRALPAPFAAGTIRGRVLVGNTSARPAFALPPAPEGCAQHPFTAGSNGALSETVVTILNVRGGVAPRDGGPAVTLDRCGFTPRVSVGLEGSIATVRVAKGEHRLQASLGEVRLFDAGATGAQPISLVAEGLWTLRCATSHPWEQAWIQVTPNPYATVTDRDGHFVLTDIPSGRWTLRAWNPAFGERTADALVEVNRESDLTIRY